MSCLHLLGSESVSDEGVLKICDLAEEVPFTYLGLGKCAAMMVIISV